LPAFSVTNLAKMPITFKGKRYYDAYDIPVVTMLSIYCWWNSQQQWMRCMCCIYRGKREAFPSRLEKPRFL